MSQAVTYGRTGAGAIGLTCAFVTVTALAIGSFTQQALRTGACPQIVTDNGANASSLVAHYVPGFEDTMYRTYHGYKLSHGMKNAMVQGLADPQSYKPITTWSWPSGNCTFPDHGTGVTHASIGLCSKCIDTTSRIYTSIDEDDFGVSYRAYRLPNNLPHGSKR